MTPTRAPVPSQPGAEDQDHDDGFAPTFLPDAMQERLRQQVGFLPIDPFFTKTMMMW